MSFRKVSNRIRYNYWFSRLVLFFSYPFFKVSRSLLSAVRTKVKINGTSVLVYDTKIVFPKDVGVNINSKLFWNGSESYEPYASKTLRSLFRQADYFLDIGSNFGLYSVLAQKINPAIIVKCFEPLPSMNRDNVNFHKANGTSRQTISSEAISNADGEVKFYVPDVYSIKSEITSSSIEKDFHYNQKFPHREITVKTTTLDGLLLRDQSMSGRRIALKIDVEGHELKILQGGKNFFDKLRPIGVMEINRTPENTKAVYDILEGFGYLLFAIDVYGYYKLSLPDVLDFNGTNDFLIVPREVVTGNYISMFNLDKIWKDE